MPFMLRPWAPTPHSSPPSLPPSPPWLLPSLPSNRQTVALPEEKQREEGGEEGGEEGEEGREGGGEGLVLGFVLVPRSNHTLCPCGGREGGRGGGRAALARRPHDKNKGGESILVVESGGREREGRREGGRERGEREGQGRWLRGGGGMDEGEGREGKRVPAKEWGGGEEEEGREGGKEEGGEEGRRRVLFLPLSVAGGKEVDMEVGFTSSPPRGALIL